jgi:hypothetical protein
LLHEFLGQERVFGPDKVGDFTILEQRRWNLFDERFDLEWIQPIEQAQARFLFQMFD